MKKILLSLGLIGIFGGLLATTSASSTSCKEVEFSNGITACVNIEYAGTNRRNLTTDIDGGSTSNLRCDIMTPDSILRSVSSCNGSFSYSQDKAGRVKLWIRYSNAAPTDWEGKPDSSSERTYPQWVFDFDNEERSEDDLTSTSSSSSDDFYITASPSSPDEDESVDITVKARDGSSTDTAYRGTVRFKVERRNESDSERISASSSLYELDRTSYTFTSSDDGIHRFNDLVTFTNDSYDYRLVVYDDDDIEGYKVFDFGNGYDESDDENDTDNFYIVSSTSNPSTSQYVDVTVRARDGSSTDDTYRGTIKFKVQRKSGSSRITASSSYYTLSRTSYTFTSSDDGIHEFSDLIKFTNNNYDYRLVIYDSSDSSIEGEKTFYVNTDDDEDDESDYDTDNFYLSTDDTTPNINQYVDLTVKARDGSSTDTAYRGTVQFEVYYKASGSSTWTKTTSLSYYEMKYPYEDNGYTFNSSNDGNITITDFIRFRRDDYSYKVVVYDEDDESIDGEKIFTVGSTNDSDTDSDNFYLSTDDTTPNTNQYVDLTVKARDGSSTDTTYRGTVQFEVYYKASGSSTWTKTTSSSYYTMNSSYDDGYTFTSSNAGQKTFSDLIQFKKNNYSYKVLVYDEDDENIDGEKIFTVGDVDEDDSDSNSDNFYLSTDDTTPSTYQYVDLTVKARDGSSTDTAYRGTVQFEVYYKASGSSTWTRTTSSSYYAMNSSYTDGYTFTSSNAGQKTFSDLIQFKKNNYSYKVLVYDEDDESIEGEKIFTVGSVNDNDNDSSVDGFTSSELTTVEDMYDARDTMIYNLESTYSALRTNNRRQTMSDDLKDAMYEIIHDNNNKTYDNFDDFYDAFLDRYRYTVSVR